jgi:hypothetical protein
VPKNEKAQLEDFKIHQLGFFVWRLTAMTAIEEKNNKEFDKRTQEIMSELRESLGPTVSFRFLGDHPAFPSIRTLRNLKSTKTEKRIPSEVFYRTDAGIMVRTSEFLKWYFGRARRA